MQYIDFCWPICWWGHNSDETYDLTNCIKPVSYEAKFSMRRGFCVKFLTPLTYPEANGSTQHIPTSCFILHQILVDSTQEINYIAHAALKMMWEEFKNVHSSLFLFLSTPPSLYLSVSLFLCQWLFTFPTDSWYLTENIFVCIEQNFD